MLMASSLSCLADNLTKGLYKVKCTDIKSNLKYIATKNNIAIFKCVDSNKNHEKGFNKDLAKRFESTYRFSDIDIISTFILMLQKGVCPYDYMGSLQKVNELTLPEKKEFYSNINIEGITDLDYEHAKKVWKDLKLKILGVYHDLFVQGNTLLLANIMCLRTFKTSVFKYFNLIQLTFDDTGIIVMASMPKKD